MDPVTVTAAAEAASKAANYAALQSDRWMFVVTLIVFLVAIGWMAKWFMARFDALQLRIDTVQKEFNDFLQARNTTLASAIEKNSHVVEKCEETITNAVKLLDRMNQKQP